jgi:hypothetical protein
MVPSSRSGWDPIIQAGRPSSRSTHLEAFINLFCSQLSVSTKRKWIHTPALPNPPKLSPSLCPSFRDSILILQKLSKVLTHETNNFLSKEQLMKLSGCLSADGRQSRVWAGGDGRGLSRAGILALM